MTWSLVYVESKRVSFWTLKKEVESIAEPPTRLQGPGMGIGVGEKSADGRIGAVQGKVVVFTPC